MPYYIISPLLSAKYRQTNLHGNKMDDLDEFDEYDLMPDKWLKLIQMSGAYHRETAQA